MNAGVKATYLFVPSRTSAMKIKFYSFAMEMCSDSVNLSFRCWKEIFFTGIGKIEGFFIAKEKNEESFPTYYLFNLCIISKIIYSFPINHINTI